MRVAAIVFEGGPPARNALEQTIQHLRGQVTLDTLERLRAVAGVEKVLLATNRPDLAEAAAGLGVEVHGTGPAFHFGRELARAVRAAGADAVIYLSGAAVPLLGHGDWEWVVGTLRTRGPCVVTNNPQSADLVAWSPAGALDRIEVGEHDNLLGFLLRHQAGLERYLLPSSAAVHFDLDTPTDYLILAESGRAGPRAAAALARLPWDRSRVRALRAVLRQDLAELGLVGRVGTAVVDYLNTFFRLRLRIFSEERGMKALGREQQGLVVSFLAGIMDDLGPRQVFRRLAEVCHGICFDSRVVMAHGGRRVSEWDRYHSDLGEVAAIRDPWVQEFTAAALSAPVPVLLGGHSVVSGGLWLMAEQVLAEGGGAGVRYR